MQPPGNDAQSSHQAREQNALPAHQPRRFRQMLWWVIGIVTLLVLALTACTLPGPTPVPSPSPAIIATVTATTPVTPTQVALASPSPRTTPATPQATPTRAPATPTTSPTRATPARGTPATPGRGTPGAAGTPRPPFTPTADEPCVASELDQPPLPEKPATVATIEQAYRCLLRQHVSRKTTLDHKVLLNGAWDIFREAGLPAQDVAPLQLVNDREADWKIYEGRYNTLVKKYGTVVDQSLLARTAIDGMARSLKDNHVAYLEPKLWRRFQKETAGDEMTVGPGFDLAVDDASGKFYLYKVFPGTSAAQGGLKAGDVIEQVNNRAAAKGVGNQGLYDLLTGDVGTRASVRVQRPATGQTLTVQVTVSEYRVPLIEARVLEGGVGYIKLSQFSITAGDEFDKALAGLQAQGITSLIFDVRQNPGGSTDALRHILSHFTHQGPHAITIDEDGKRSEENPDSDVPLLGLPWVVLCDGGSASSSDITAAVAKDRGGWLIGVKSAGALGAAQVFELADGSALEITVNLVLGPDGEQINEVGVTPNQVVTMTPADLSAGNDPQLQAALAYLKSR